MKKMLRTIVMMAFGYISSTGVAFAGANLVNNPSFEIPFGPSNWDSLGGATRTTMVGDLLPTDGAWMLDLFVRPTDGYAGVNQVNLGGLVPSGTYQLNFDWAAPMGGGTMFVDVGVFNVAKFDVSGTGWQHHSEIFTTPGGIAFSMYIMSDGGEFLVDNIHFAPAVPEPETYAMMLAGFSLIGAGSAWRRQKQQR